MLILHFQSPRPRPGLTTAQMVGWFAALPFIYLFYIVLCPVLIVYMVARSWRRYVRLCLKKNKARQLAKLGEKYFADADKTKMEGGR